MLQNISNYHHINWYLSDTLLTKKKQVVKYDNPILSSSYRNLETITIPVFPEKMVNKLR